MSSADLVDLVNATLSVRTYLGTIGSGVKTYAAAVDVPGWLTRKQAFVRDSNGNQVVSQASFSAVVDWADTFAPQSLVTVPGERQTTVISREVSIGGGFVDGLDRVKVFLQ